ncbi:MAG: DUF3365 domain-containing protein [Elusimicrobiota bacterium]|nr:DUF3365 domain-containing protein [Elusimicrobiota bacterium]
MNRVLNMSLSGREIGRLSLLAGAVWTVFIFGSLALGLRHQRLAIVKQAESEAETIAGMDLSFRNWVIGHGGVYITGPGKTSPTPYLRAQTKEIKTATGGRLVLVSHAYAMRQLSEARALQGLPYSHITASKPKDPASAPNEWERAALAGFERGERETLVSSYGGRVRFIRAFRQEAACLPCHAPGESVGGVHGAISVEVPLKHFVKIGGPLRLYWTAGHALIWLAGMFGIIFGCKYLKRAQAGLRASEDKYRNLFDNSRDALMTLAPPAWAFTSGNAATLAMFGAGNEAEFTARGPLELSPERQPDGRLSSEKARELIETAMSRGKNLFEWTHRRIGGEEFTAEVFLTRMELDGKAFLQASVRDISERKLAHAQREALLAELKESLAQVKYLSGLIPICASCKKIRNDKGAWESVECYVTEHSDAKFSHGICPDCGKRLYGEFYEEKPGPGNKGG